MNHHTSLHAFIIGIFLVSPSLNTGVVRATMNETTINNLTPRTTAAVTQNRDWLTDEEDMRVREAQEIDKRIDVFVKVIERRLFSLTGSPVAASKQSRKDAEKYGELRNGTPPELLSDIVRALNAAVDNIDDASSRPAQKALLPKAFEKLQTAARQHRTQFSVLRDATKDTDTIRLLDQSIEITDSIIAARINADTKPKAN